MTVSFPILGTLMLISITIGLLAKAAPQMNLLMMGFPVAIGVALLVLFLSMPFIVAAFARIIEDGFQGLAELIGSLQAAGGS